MITINLRPNWLAITERKCYFILKTEYFIVIFYLNEVTVCTLNMNPYCFISLGSVSVSLGCCNKIHHRLAVFFFF